MADPSPGRDSFKLEGVRVKGCLGAIMPEELKKETLSPDNRSLHRGLFFTLCHSKAHNSRH